MCLKRLAVIYWEATKKTIISLIYKPQLCNYIRGIKKKRDLHNGVRVSDDLIWEDRQKKKQLRSVMKEAFEAGKRPRFHHGKLYIDGELHQAWDVWAIFILCSCVSPILNVYIAL